MTSSATEDWQLLQAYAKDHSEAAFAGLVKSHLDWVYSVALRNVGDPHLAQDVVQSVFVLLRAQGAQSPLRHAAHGLVVSHHPACGWPLPAH